MATRVTALAGGPRDRYLSFRDPRLSRETEPTQLAPPQIVQHMSVPGSDMPDGQVVALVAVHGNGGGAHRFARVAPLMPPDVAMTAVTLPGFAAVPADRSLRSLADFADCLADLIAP